MSLNGWLQYANGTATGKLCWSVSMKNFWNREDHLPTGQYFHRKAGTVRPDYKKRAEGSRRYGSICIFYSRSALASSEKTMEGFVCEMEKQHADLGSVCHVKRPVIRSGFPENIFQISGHSEIREEKDPEKHPEEIRWYPVAHAKELEDVDYNFDNNLIVPDGAC